MSLSARVPALRAVKTDDDSRAGRFDELSAPVRAYTTRSVLPEGVLRLDP